MDKDCLAGDSPVAEDRPMRGDAENAKACSYLVADAAGKLDRLLRRTTVSCAAVPNGR